MENLDVQIDDEGNINVRLDRSIGLSQDFMLELLGQMQSLKTEYLGKQAAKKRWWPASVRCHSCNRKIAIDDEPKNFVLFCEGCGNVVVVKPND